MMFAAALAALVLAGSPDIILVTIDTLRADRVGAYGSKTGASPALDAMAARGVVVDEAVVQTPQTRPSHASILTGLLPFQHGLRDNASPPLRKNLPTLAATLKASGYATAAFIAAYPVSRASGLESGFDVFDDPFGGDADFLAGSGDRNERPAREVVDAAIAWLTRPSTKPRFVWVHLFEPHYPYEPASPFKERFPKSPYDGEIATADHELKRLFDRYPASSSRLWVVTSDHGEGLGDHGEDEHHLFVYDSTLKVPLILEGGGLPQGSRVRGQFRSIDLMPTILDLVRVDAPPVTGVSRAVNLRTGGRIPDNESYAESLYGATHFGYAPVRALRVEGFKFIDTPKAELYRVASDPAETSNLVDARAPLASALRQRLRELHGEDAAKAAAPTALDPAAIERLAALGYVGAAAPVAPVAAQDQGLPDAKDRVAHYHRYSRAVNAALAARRNGDPQEVVTVLRGVAGEFGSHYSVASFLGEALLELRKFQEAVPYLTKARDLSSKAGPVWGRLAEALMGAGRAAEAKEAIEKGLQASPRSTDLIRLRVAVLSREGRNGDALVFLEKAVKANPRDGLLHAELANLHRNSGDLEAAEVASRRAVDLQPGKADVWVSRGLVLGARDQKDQASAAFVRARDLEPANPDAWFYGAVLELQRGDSASAQKLLARAEVLEPSRPGLREVRQAVLSSGASVAKPAPAAPPAGAVHLRLIRVNTREAADTVLKRLTAGEAFMDAAREVSNDPSRTRGGDLGWMVPEDLAEPLRSIAKDLAPGQFSNVIVTSRGFVLLKRER